MAGIGTGLAALNVADRLAGVGAFFKRVPRWVWIALATAVLLVAGYIYHGHKVAELVATTRADQKTADDAAWKKKLDQAHADALAWRQKAEREGAAIARLNKDKADVEIRDHAALADALSLRGPGAAASRCGPGDHPAAAAVAGGRNKAAADADAARPQVPAGDRAAMSGGQWATVPWDWLVKRAQEHDDLLTVEITRRRDGAQQRDAWEKMRAGKSP